MEFTGMHWFERFKFLSDESDLILALTDNGIPDPNDIDREIDVWEISDITGGDDNLIARNACPKKCLKLAFEKLNVEIK